MDKGQQVNLPTCAECHQPFSWDNAYHHDDTPGSASYNPPGHGLFRPRAYCPNCGTLVAEWHINQVEDCDEWAWYGANAALNSGRPLPPSPLYAWGKGVPLQFVPKFEEHRLVLDAGGNPTARSEVSGRVVDSLAARVPAPTSESEVRAAPSPAQGSSTDQVSATEICKRCGRSIPTSELTCPYCGYTKWGLIITSLVLFLLCLGAAILGGPRISVSWLRLAVMWGGGIIASICVAALIVAAIDGLYKSRKLRSGSSVMAGAGPSLTGAPQATSTPEATSTVRVTVKISGAIHGSAEHRGTYEMTLPLDVRGPHLLNTIASRIIRPEGPVRYYNGYQLYGTRGTSALTCDALRTETLRTLGIKDGDILEFCDMGGSFM